MTSNSHPRRGFRISGELARARAVLNRYGAAETIKKVAAYPLDAAKAHANYWAYRKRYPTNLIFIAGLAKSGSTWLADMLQSLPGFARYQPAAWTASFLHEPHQDIYAELFQEVRTRLAVVKGHTSGSPDNVLELHKSGYRYLVTVRDPRDQVISGYWYLRNRPNHPAHSLAMRLTLEDFLTHELDPQTAAIRRGDWIREWLSNRDRNQSVVVKYEDLLGDTIGEMSRILRFLEIDAPLSQLEAIVRENSFENRSGRARGAEDTSSFMRRGIAGEWKEVFNRGHNELSRAAFEDLIQALDYEPTPVEPV